MLALDAKKTAISGAAHHYIIFTTDNYMDWNFHPIDPFPGVFLAADSLNAVPQHKTAKRSLIPSSITVCQSADSPQSGSLFITKYEIFVWLNTTGRRRNVGNLFGERRS